MPGESRLAASEGQAAGDSGQRMARLAIQRAVDSLDRDHVLIGHVQDAVRADAEPVVPAAVERLSGVRVISQPLHGGHDRPHAGLVAHEPAR